MSVVNVEMVVRGLVVKVGTNLRSWDTVSGRNGICAVFPQFLEQGKMLFPQTTNGFEDFRVNNANQIEILHLFAAPLEVRQNDETCGNKYKYD